VIKRWNWLLVILSLGIFLALRFHSIGKKTNIETTPLPQLHVPKPLIVKTDPLSLLPLPREDQRAKEHFQSLLSHPWIQNQPQVKELSIEMVRDIELLQHFCQQLQHEEKLSDEKISEIVIQTITTLQEEIPFSLPKELYNVLCIPQTTPTADFAPPLSSLQTTLFGRDRARSSLLPRCPSL